MLLGIGLPKPAYNTTATGGQETSSFVPPLPAKDIGCEINAGLPDANCTPGAVMAGATKEQICTFGYSKSVRDVTAGTKQAIFSAYGIDEHKAGEYQVDHLISLELGGSNDTANLWPQPAEPIPGYHQKDQLENYLHDQICGGKLSLTEAQRKISTNWIKAYHDSGF